MRVCPKCFAQESEDARFCGLCGHKLFEVQAGNSTLVGLVLGGKYAIQKLIAKGGMGEVYLAEHKEIGQRVAVKILNRRMKDDATVVMRFFNEAKSYTKVSHPNAVRLYDFGQLDDGTLYIIMEFVPGETLTAHLEADGPMAQRMTLGLSKQLADVLLAAHNQGIVHRDLKPDNIMLLEVSPGRFHIKVLDFGIAKFVDESNKGLTETGMVFGTPEFMSPEQAQGIDVDHRTDIYAFGMLLYYMLSHRLPFEAINKLALLNKQVHEQPRPPSEVAPNVDIHPGMEALIMRCLRKDRRERYSSFADVLSDLERIERDEPLSAAETRVASATGMPAYISLDDETRRVSNSPTVSFSARSQDGEPVILVSSDELPAVAGGGALSDIVDGGGPDPREEITVLTGVEEVDDDLPELGDDELAETNIRGEPTYPEHGVTLVESSAGRPAPHHPRDPDLDSVPSAVSGTDGFRLGADDDEDEGFSLGDGLAFDEAPLLRGDTSQRRSSAGGLTGAVVLVALLLGGALVWYFVVRDQNTSAEPKTPLVANETSRVEETAAAADVVSSPEPDAVSAADMADAPAAGAPQPAPALLGAVTRRQAVFRVLLQLASTRLQSGDLDGADRIAAFEKKHGAGLAESVRSRAQTQRDHLKKARDLIAIAKKDSRRLRCGKVAEAAVALQEIAPGAVPELTAEVDACKMRLAAPPTQID